MSEKMSQKAMLVERKTSCHVANDILSRLENLTHIQAENLQNVQK